jgi:hypothetical protein
LRTQRDVRDSGGCRMAPVLLTPEKELTITRCMLLGASFHYDDYGRPERANVRNYHTCTGPAIQRGDDPPWSSPRYQAFVTGYGKTQVEAAYDWLHRTGHIEKFKST